MHTPSEITTEQTNRYIVLCVICLGSCLSPLSMAAVSIAIPSLANALQADAVLVSWLPTAFLLSNVALMLPFGKLADNYGRKRIYALGLTTNACGSLAAYLSPSIEWILFFRFLQGAGSAMIFGTALAIVTSVFDARERGLPLGLNTASVYIGLTAAPVLGGWITEAFGWRAVFLLPLPFTAILLLVIHFFLHSEWRKDTHSSFDWVGTFIFAGWALSLVIGLTGLPQWHSIAALLLSCCLLVLFIKHQAGNPEPLIRVQLFRESRLFSFSLASASLMYGAMYPLNFVLSLYLQYIRGLSPLESGQLIMVQAFAMALLAPIAGKLSDRIQPRVIATVGCTCVAVGFFMLCQLGFNTPTVYVSTALFFIGIGFGLFSAPNHNAVMSSVPSDEVGVASATISLARVCGNLIGISLINLLVHLLLEDNQITPELYDQLLVMIRYAMVISSTVVVAAVLFSASRGTVKPHTETSNNKP
jgi:EmrB/QacA subfamily drug resistance transporter